MAKRVSREEFEHLCRMIQRWNENRLELFEITMPSYEVSVYLDILLTLMYCRVYVSTLYMAEVFGWFIEKCCGVNNSHRKCQALSHLYCVTIDGECGCGRGWGLVSERCTKASAAWHFSLQHDPTIMLFCGGLLVVCAPHQRLAAHIHMATLSIRECPPLCHQTALVSITHIPPPPLLPSSLRHLRAWSLKVLCGSTSRAWGRMVRKLRPSVSGCPTQPQQRWWSRPWCRSSVQTCACWPTSLPMHSTRCTLMKVQECVLLAVSVHYGDCSNSSCTHYMCIQWVYRNAASYGQCVPCCISTVAPEHVQLGVPTTLFCHIFGCITTFEML